MPLILAIEPDRKQASQLTSMVRGRLHAELVLAESAERALTALGDRIPDLVLTSALLSPKDEAALGERLRALDGHAAHVQTLTIPVLASRSSREGRGGVLFGLRREKNKSSAHEGCDPDVFAEQCREYLERAETERAFLIEQAARVVTKSKDPVRPVSPSKVTGSEWVVVQDDTPPAESAAAAGATAGDSQATAHPEAAASSTSEPATPAYDAPAPLYEPSTSAYDSPAPLYNPPAPAYESRAPLYEPPTPVSEPPTPAYDSPAPLYEPSAGTYDSPAPLYEPPAPAFDTRAPLNQPPTNPDSHAPLYAAPDHDSPAPLYEPSPPAASSGQVPFQSAATVQRPADAFVRASTPAKSSEPVESPPQVDRVLREFLELTSNPADGPASLLAAVAALEAEEQNYIVAPPAEPVSEPPVQARAAAAEATNNRASSGIVLDDPDVIDLSSMLQPESNSSSAASQPFSSEPSPDVYELDATMLDISSFDASPAAPARQSAPPAPAAPAIQPAPPAVPQRSSLSDLEDIFKNTPDLTRPTPAASTTPKPAAVHKPVDLKEWVDILDALRRDAAQLEAIQPAKTNRLLNPAPPEPLDMPRIFAETVAPLLAPPAPPTPPAAAAPPVAAAPVAAAPVAPSAAPAPPAAPAASSATAPSPSATAAPPPPDPPVPAEPAEHASSPETAASKRKRKSPKTTPAQDEWGFYDPDQCGIAALMEKLDEIAEGHQKPAKKRGA